jgi:hypothetical protein
MRGFAKERNMRRNPRVTLLCYDPHRPLRYLEVRGMAAEMTEAGVFTTPGHDGQPQSTVVRAGLDRERALVNTTLERQKGRNLLGNPKASLLVVDPGNTSRFSQIRDMGGSPLPGNAARSAGISWLTRRPCTAVVAEPRVAGPAGRRSQAGGSRASTVNSLAYQAR